jgi:hypothetical protein
MGRIVTSPDIYKDLESIESRLSSLERISGPSPIETFLQEGENNAWVSYSSAGETVYVNSGKTIPLRWVYTPPINVWVEVHVQCMRRNTAAAWVLADLSTTVSPAPEEGATPKSSRVNIHNAFDGVVSSNNFICALASGVTYTISSTLTDAGATGQYYQGSNWLWMTGKAWRR